ncbi:MAG: bifunctional phosphoribosylaminoimidazolecarboxamide formyltransferase/IMP cyclohydrolase [Vampirovibrionales bacterium]|nr:bifunctional phosphoribosylaminoimidazolecarboxamide formyltransferase/IMP cyclohydrolase [Vampirovibrionales bacterium]
MTLKRPLTVFCSVYEKSGLIPLLEPLVRDFQAQIVATGGTAKHLQAAGLPVIELGSITGFDQLLGGRVKSLHPTVFAALLASENTGRLPDPALLALPFYLDVAVVNLYPFEAGYQERISGKPDVDLIELIDIGGVSLIRAAAKNHAHVSILTRPQQYEEFLASFKAAKQAALEQPALACRQRWALEAFRHTAAYDATIAHALSETLAIPEPADALPTAMTLPLIQAQPMRYGENPHQAAALYSLAGKPLPFRVLQGKALSYNNLLDIDAGWALVREFNDGDQGEIACAIIKHNNPCGVAISEKSSLEAYSRALEADPVSAFGGIVCLNHPVDEETAKAMAALFLEVIVAPGFTPDALAVLSAKKNLRLVTMPLTDVRSDALPAIKQLGGGLFLAQKRLLNSSEENVPQSLSIPTRCQPSPELLEDLRLGWKVAKHVKSNAMVLVKEGQTVGIGGGQTSRIGALELALNQACDAAKGAALASDGFLPAVDNVYAAAQARVGAIIQPGGSIKDPEVIALADQLNLPMVFTGVREFKH